MRKLSAISSVDSSAQLDCTSPEINSPLVVGVFLNGQYRTVIVKDEWPLFTLPLWRADTREPQIIFGDGFVSWGLDANLLHHAAGYTSGAAYGERRSAFIPTSKNISTAASFALMYNCSSKADCFIYRINPQLISIDVNKVLGNKSPYPHENEVVIPYKIYPSDIAGAYSPSTCFKASNPGYKQPTTSSMPLVDKLRNTLIESGEILIGGVVLDLSQQQFSNKINNANTLHIESCKRISLTGTPVIYEVVAPDTFNSNFAELMHMMQNPARGSLGLEFYLNGLSNNPTKALSNLYKANKFLERSLKYSGLDIFRLSQFNKVLKNARYFSLFRDGNLFSVPFYWFNSKGRSSFFLYAPKVFLAVDATAMLVDGVAPALIARNDQLINKYEAFAVKYFAHLSEIQRNIIASDSMLDDMRFANNQLRAIHAVANAYNNLSKRLYDHYIPNQWKQATQNFRRQINQTRQDVLTHYVEQQDALNVMREKQFPATQPFFDEGFDIDCPFTLRDISNFLAVIQTPIDDNQDSHNVEVIDDKVSQIPCLPQENISNDIPSKNNEATPGLSHQLHWVNQHSADGTFIGVGWTPPNSNMQYNVGFKFDQQETSGLVTSLLNRAIASNSEYQTVTIAGHTYGFKIKENNATATITIYPLPKNVAKHRGKKEIVCDLHFWKGVCKANTQNDFDVDSWRARKIQKALLGGLNPYIERNFSKDVLDVNGKVNNMLAAGSFDEARALLQIFFNKSNDHPEAKSVYESGVAICEFNRLVSRINERLGKENTLPEIYGLISSFEQQYSNDDMLKNNLSLLRDELNKYEKNIDEFVAAQHQAYQLKCVELFSGYFSIYLSSYKDNIHPANYVLAQLLLNLFSPTNPEFLRSLPGFLCPFISESNYNSVLGYTNEAVKFGMKANISFNTGWYIGEMYFNPSINTFMKMTAPLLMPITDALHQHYQNRHANGDAPETYFGTLAKDVIGLANDPYVNFTASRAADVASLALFALPALDVFMTGGTITYTAYAAVGILAAAKVERDQYDNIYHNAHHALLTSFSNQEKYSDAKAKLEKISKEYPLRKLDLEKYPGFVTSYLAHKSKIDTQIVAMCDMPTTPESQLFGGNYEKMRLDGKGIHDVAYPKTETQGGLSESLKVMRSHSKYTLESIQAAVHNLHQSQRELRQLAEREKVSEEQFAHMESLVAPEDKASMSDIDRMRDQSVVAMAAEAKLKRYCAKAERIIVKRTIEHRIHAYRVRKLTSAPFYRFFTAQIALTRDAEKELLSKPSKEYLFGDTRSRFCF